MKIKNRTIAVILRDRLGDLMQEAGVSCSEETLINIQQDIDNVFHGCETREDAVQRIKELAEVVEM